MKTRRKAERLLQLQIKIKIFFHATVYLPSKHWFTVSLSYLTNSQMKPASYFPDEIADCIFYQEKQGDEYLFQIKFLMKQNLNIGLYHVY